MIRLGRDKVGVWKCKNTFDYDERGKCQKPEPHKSSAGQRWSYALTCIPRSLVPPSMNFLHVHTGIDTLLTWHPCAWHVHPVYCHYLPHRLNWSVKVLSFFGVPSLILRWPPIQLRILDVVGEVVVKLGSWMCISSSERLLFSSSSGHHRLLDNWWS